jgi:Predicted integral membrane protein
MKQCEIVQDLLPLYKDKVVSASGIEMVEEHLKTCEDCKRELENLQTKIKIDLGPTEKAEVESLQLVKKKLRRRTIKTACIAVVLGIVLFNGAIAFLHNTEVPLPYSDAGITDISVDFEKQTVNISSVNASKSTSSTELIVLENGHATKVLFITYSQTLYEKWFAAKRPLTADTNAGTFTSFSSANQQFDRCEVYYTTAYKDFSLESRENAVLVYAESAGNELTP